MTTFSNALTDRLRNKVDILIFNPPYVVTTTEELRAVSDTINNPHSPTSNPINASWAGGIDGREVLDRWIDSNQIDELLSSNGLFYLVAIKQNKPQQICDLLNIRYGFISEVNCFRNYVDRLNMMSDRAGTESWVRTSIYIAVYKAIGYFW